MLNHITKKYNVENFSFTDVFFFTVLQKVEFIGMVELINRIQYGDLHPREILTNAVNFEYIEYHKEIYHEIIVAKRKFDISQNDLFLDTIAIFTEETNSWKLIPNTNIEFADLFPKSLSSEFIVDNDYSIQMFIHELKEDHLKLLSKKGHSILHAKHGYLNNRQLDSYENELIVYIALVVGNVENIKNEFLNARYKVLAIELKRLAIKFISSSPNRIQEGLEYLQELKKWVQKETHNYGVDKTFMETIVYLEKIMIKKGAIPIKKSTYTIEIRENINRNDILPLFQKLFEIIKEHFLSDDPQWKDFKRLITGNELTVQYVWKDHQNILAYIFRSLHQVLTFNSNKWETVCKYFKPEKGEFNPDKLKGDSSFNSLKKASHKELNAQIKKIKEFSKLK